MTKTSEQKNAEFIDLLTANGFTLSDETTHDGRPVYSRSWSKQVQVVWYGQQESTMEIRADIAWGIPAIRIFKNSRFEDHRCHTSPKRCVNAMREIVSYAGFEF